MIDFHFDQYATGVGGHALNAMDVNNHLEFVEIHNNGEDKWMFYGAGKVVGDKAVFETNGSTLNFGTLGMAPKISISDNRMVVATFIGGLDPFRYLYCSTGTFKNGAVDWFSTTLKTYCSTPEAIFDTSINNAHFVLAYTYRNLSVDWGHIHTYLKLGKVNPGTGNIEWLDDGWNDVGRGTMPSVSMNNSGSVIVLAQSTDSPNKLYYKAGHVNGNTVTWDSGEIYIPDIDTAGITSITITLSDSNEVLLSYVVKDRGYCMLGVLSADRRKINFTSRPRAYSVGKHDGITVLVGASCGSGKALMCANDGTAFPGLYAGVGSMNRNWIGNNMKVYGARKLREFTLPGSHDAAMSKAVSCSIGGAACNTQTQTLTVGEQLERGIRYFDLRPLLRSDGVITFGHYTKVNDVVGYLGCEGESFSDVLEAVAKFMSSTHRELVILAFSHFVDLRSGTGNRFPDDAFKQFIEAIKQKLGSHFIDICPQGSLADLTLDEITQKGSAVLPIVDCNNRLPSGCDGIFIYKVRQNGNPRISGSTLSVFDNYSNTDNLDQMITTQLDYFGNITNRRNSDLYLFSWTLTQSAISASTCGPNNPLAWSILDLADKANAALSMGVRQAIVAGQFSSTLKPNIMLADACDDHVTDVCILLNDLSVSVGPREASEDDGEIVHDEL